MILRPWQHLIASVVTTLGIFLVATLVALASILTSATIQLSTHEASTAADHTVQFVTSSGVDTSTDTIILGYESGFDLTAIGFEDIDLAVDDDASCDGTWTDKTLAATAAAGVWGASVSGQTLTLTAPTDAGAGEIASNRCVQIQIGTNADAGSNQITNPGSTGSYEIDVYGTFGDHTIYAIGINGTSSIPVTAVVPSSGSGGGGGTTPPASDTAPPAISDVLVSNITDASATVTWTTSEPASRTLAYGLDTSYSAGLESDGSYRTSHTQTLFGLTDGTEYHFQITVQDNSGNSAVSSDYTFTTLDVTSPALTLSVSAITESGMTLSWTTDEATTSEVRLDGTLVYSGGLLTADSQVFTGLAASTSYVLQVDVTDASGNTTSQSVTATTLANTPPGNVTGLTAVPGDGSMLLSWSNPTDSDFANVIVVFSTVGYPTSPSEGIVLYTGADTTFLHEGLTDGTIYYYTVFAVDTAGNLSSGSLASGSPLSPSPDPDDDGTDDPDEGTDTSDPDDAGTDTDDGDAGDGTDTPTDGGTSDTDADGTSGDTTDPDTPDGGGADGGDVGPDLDPEEDVVPDTGGPVTLSDLTFRVGQDGIVLSPTNGAVRVLANRSLAVQLRVPNGRDVASVELRLPNGTYLMNPESRLVEGGSGLTEVREQDVFQARIMSPANSGQLQVHLRYADGTTQTLTYNLRVVGSGVVTDKATGEPLAEAGVSLYRRDGSWTLWNGASYQQQNPVVTGASGTYAWYVPNGTYRVEVVRDGYNRARTVALQVTDNILGIPVQLVAVVPPIDEQIADGVPPVTAVVRQVQESIQLIRQSPTVQQTARVGTPVVAATAVTSAAVVATAFNGFQFLQYLLTAPLLLWKRRKRKRWGVVYDSIRKIPVDLAIVRLLDATTGRVVKSQVTDKQGRYLFIASPGSYKIQVHKTGFSFPSTHLAGQTRDGSFVDLYHGEPIQVREADAAVAANIPLDPAGEAAKTPTRIRVDRWIRRGVRVVSVAGLVVAIVIAVLQPSMWTIAAAALQIVAFLFFLRLAVPSKPKSWGIVYDARTRRPITNAVVRIFDPTYNKLLETQVTDGRGRYAFLVGPNEYYTTYEKGGYKKVEVRPIDRTDTQQASYVSVDVGLNKTTN